MKKKIIVLSLLVLIIAACFMPVTQQKTVSIKSPFLNIYRELVLPSNWGKWRPDIRQDFAVDSAKINFKKDTASFNIQYKNKELNVGFNENVFNIKDRWNNNSNYGYAIIPEKDLKKTSVTVVKKTIAINYLLSRLKSDPFVDTHIDDLKKFMETDSLLYGCNIFKNRVQNSYMLEIQKEVPSKDKFTEAAKMLAALKQYVNTHDVKKVQPLIAQFLPKGKDSTHINVGFYIDKEVKGENDVHFARMPKGGPLYSVRYSGAFNKRSKTYMALRQYFIDHLYQQAILPFESYLDDKLPTSDTSKVNIQVNFSTYF
jgi:effector-binding domain-containing protein